MTLEPLLGKHHWNSVKGQFDDLLLVGADVLGEVHVHELKVGVVLPDVVAQRLARLLEVRLLRRNLLGSSKFQIGILIE